MKLNTYEKIKLLMNVNNDILWFIAIANGMVDANPKTLISNELINLFSKPNDITKLADVTPTKLSTKLYDWKQLGFKKQISKPINPIFVYLLIPCLLKNVSKPIVNKTLIHEYENFKKYE